MNNPFLYIVLGFAFIVLANFAGHYFPPFSLITTFIYMNVIIGIVNIPLYKRNFNATVIYNFSLLIINDLFIRWYAGGNHDSEGMAWCWLMFHVGFIIATLIMITHALIYTKRTKAEGTNYLNTIIIGAILTGIFYNFINAKI